MVRFAFLCLLSLVLCPVARSAQTTNELDVAREALRDGLWNVARRHAAHVASEEAKMIELESYAQEKNWKGLLAAIDAMGYPEGAGFAYYRALALFHDGALPAASNTLAQANFSSAGYRRPVARLRAELARANHRSEEAISILEKDGGDDIETLMMLASLRDAEGSREAADALWRKVLSNTNASERVRVRAAVGLRDAVALKTFSEKSRSSTVRRFASLKRGVLLVRDAASFAEGEAAIRTAVNARPDAEGAREAFLALAEAYLEKGDFAHAVRAYADAMEMWPETARDAVVQEGRGWALSKLGRFSEALEAFRRAEELFADRERKSVVAVKAADMLLKVGGGKEATAAYAKIVEKYPETESAKRVANIVRLREKEERGRTLYAEFKFDAARRVFEELAREDASRRDRMNFCCVLCAYGAGDDERAEESARTLASGAQDPAVRADATLWLAKAVFNRGQWRESRRLFLRYVQLSPKSADAPLAFVWSARAALADHDFAGVISNVTTLVSTYPVSPAHAAGMLAQGEALIELGRFDEAVLVLERAALVSGVSNADRLDARIKRADALFAMGADNSAHYAAALAAYGEIRTGDRLTPGEELSISYKIARTLEKLKRLDEAVDMYYTKVVLAYRTGRLAGVAYDDTARATFSRAAFRLADEYESRGRIRQAVHVLELVCASDVPAAAEATRRIERMERKGMFP